MKEKFKLKSRLKMLFTLFVILALTIYKPFGLINFAYFESETLLLAQIEGVANCMTNLELKKNGSFVEKSFCFGPSEINGEYQLKGDTIFFHKIQENRATTTYHKFAILKTTFPTSKKLTYKIIFFDNIKDTIGLQMSIIFNHLKK